MTRILSTAIVVLLAMSASAADRFSSDPEPISVATTGRIVKIDLKSKTLKVRASDGQSFSVRSARLNLPQMMVGLKQRIGVTLPGGITIAWPGRSGKTTPKPPEDTVNNLDEYTVFVTNETVFR